MPLSVVPTSDPIGFSQPDPPEPKGPEQEPTPRLTEPRPPSGEPESPSAEPKPRASIGGSRWIDYDTHELLEMIGQLEDERRWARLREGALWAVLIHALLLLAIFLLPKYVWVPRVIEPQISTRDHKDWTYLDTPSIPTPRPPELAKPPVIDRKTLDDLQKSTQAPAPAPQEQAKVEEPKLEQPKPQPPPPIAPSPQSQSQIEAPQPKAVPARPNFAINSQNPADQLRDAMRGARGPGGAQAPPGALTQHPGAGGGVQVLSDTQGVDFNSWLQRWYWETERTWDPLIPDEVNPPIYKQGQVQIRFKVAPNGRVIDGSMVLEGRSGDTALDRAAWGALTGSSYPPLPREFHGPFVELRAVFMYNMRVQ